MAAYLEIIDWDAIAIRCRGNVDIMAATVLASRKTVERHFKKTWRMTPARWAKKRLLAKALALVRQGYSNKAIVFELKLCSDGWFCREFKREYGSPPQYFRLPAGASVAKRSL
jgi:AraC-like DNA-binding protein